MAPVRPLGAAGVRRVQTGSVPAAQVSTGRYLSDRLTEGPEDPGGREPEGDKLLHRTSTHRVGVPGLEPGTSSLSGKRSNQAELYARNSAELYRTAADMIKTGSDLVLLSSCECR